ncbi:hypothetical protein Q1695_012342 [Nippostrongylus brasiliensis]|nr:hypothetical protein Q1695_012342 [Nippostrongylus brasiliensis]
MVALTDSLAIIIYAISALSLFNNIALVAVYYFCPLQSINSYKYFFLFTAIEGIVYSGTFIVSVPRVISQKGFFIFVATGVFHSPPIGHVALLIFNIAFFSSAFLVTNGFIYRYLQMCRTSTFQNMSSKKSILIGFIVNTVLLMNIGAVVYIGFWPDDEFARIIEDNVIIPNMSIEDTSFVGLSIMHLSTISDIIVLVDFVIVMCSAIAINAYCARKINKVLKNAVSSRSSLTLQRQMFTLLLLQVRSSSCEFHAPTDCTCVKITFSSYIGLLLQ